MKSRFLVFWLCLLGGSRAFAPPVELFDGKSLAGWEGETNSVWRVRDGVIVGGSFQGNPRNEFLATRKRYKNFHLRLEYKLAGTEGFVNSGVQFRSQRIPNPPHEVSGFQADIGAGYSGCLYDEFRRNRTLVTADSNLVARLEQPGEWNRYEIVANGPEILILLNGQRTVTWVEHDPGIADEGIIALQIHGNNHAEVSFRNLSIEELPPPNVPTESEVLARFGDGQPGLPLAPFIGGKFLLGENEIVALVGQENFVREQKAGEMESQLVSGFAARSPRLRCMAWEGDTVYEQWRELNFGPWVRQLETAGITVVAAQFGQMEALDGVARLPEFTAAYNRLLDQFSLRTRRLVLLSPMPFEKPLASDAPDLTRRNGDVAAYVRAVRDLARLHDAAFVDLFTPLERRTSGTRLTVDGIHLTAAGLREMGALIRAQLGGEQPLSASLAPLREAIVEKNRLWFDGWRPANWSFVYGDRVSQMFGKAGNAQPSLKEEYERHRPLIAAADARIRAIARGVNLPAPAPPPAVSPASSAPEDSKALSPEEELATFTLADGYDVNLFASEREGVVKPTQIAWDEKGRLYVACSPTYPQTLAGNKPHDYILALEDTQGSGRADKVWRFAEGLTMVEGLEPGEGGLFVCDFDQIVHLRDTTGNGRADERQVVLSGFGIGDTHQLVNSITHGPDGSLWFTQGLHAFSRVETPWGIARLDRAGVWRLRPRTLRLEGFFGGGMAGANCWGVAFDDFGQVFHKSADRPQGYWTVPGMVRGSSPIGSGSTTSSDASYANSPEQYHSVGPLFDSSPKTTSLEFIGTRALPDEIQGCALICGYFGSVMELHRLEDAGSGFKTLQLPKLLKSSDPSFRPVDVCVGPDGAIYIADWFNPVIGHYQASYADPRRDKTHGRIWRITAKGRPRVKAPNLAAMTLSELLEQLHSPERWTRYQVKRLLFDAPSAEVLKAADTWVDKLHPQAPDYERMLFEVAGVFQAHEAPRPDLLRKLLNAKDPRVRAYGARVAGGWAEQLPDTLKLLHDGAQDSNPRVRLESVVAASYLPIAESVEIVTTAWAADRDPFLDYAIRQSAKALQPRWESALAAHQLHFGGSSAQAEFLRKFAGTPPVPVSLGQSVYETVCLPCHQPEGKGLPGVYPPLAGSDWVAGDMTPLIKIVLHGLAGPIQVAGRSYGASTSVAMPSLASLTDQQVANVLTFIRRQFVANQPPVTPEDVTQVRAANIKRLTQWTASELRK